MVKKQKGKTAKEEEKCPVNANFHRRTRREQGVSK